MSSEERVPRGPVCDGPLVLTCPAGAELCGDLAQCHLLQLRYFCRCESYRLLGLKRALGDDSPCAMLSGEGDRALGMVGMSCGELKELGAFRLREQEVKMNSVKSMQRPLTKLGMKESKSKTRTYEARLNPGSWSFCCSEEFLSIGGLKRFEGFLSILSDVLLLYPVVLLYLIPFPLSWLTLSCSRRATGRVFGARSWSKFGPVLVPGPALLHSITELTDPSFPLASQESWSVREHCWLCG